MIYSLSIHSRRPAIICIYRVTLALSLFLYITYTPHTRTDATWLKAFSLNWKYIQARHRSLLARGAQNLNFISLTSLALQWVSFSQSALCPIQSTLMLFLFNFYWKTRNRIAKEVRLTLFLLTRLKLCCCLHGMVEGTRLEYVSSYNFIPTTKYSVLTRRYQKWGVFFFLIFKAYVP